MRIKTMKVRVIQMTAEEAGILIELARDAKGGTLQHSASTTLADGTQLTLNVMSEDDIRASEAADRHAAMQARRRRFEPALAETTGKVHSAY